MARKTYFFNDQNLNSVIWKTSKAGLFYLIVSIFLSACGNQFQTIDTHAPTTSNPLDAEKLSFDLVQPSSDELQVVAAFCDPNDLGGFTTFEKKKFVCAILPGAIRMSKQVYKQRLQVQALHRKSQSTSLSVEEVGWLNRIKVDYNLKEAASIEDLLVRVDIVPLPLIIAQAAVESGWGTSRAALQGKNLFGIHGSFGKDQCLTAQKNKSVCIKKYQTSVEGIADYIQFQNTKSSSEAFRQRRVQFRRAQTPLDPLQLAETLHLYSERGADYTRYLQRMMVEQNFMRFTFIDNN